MGCRKPRWCAPLSSDQREWLYRLRISASPETFRVESRAAYATVARKPTEATTLSTAEAKASFLACSLLSHDFAVRKTHCQGEATTRTDVSGAIGYFHCLSLEPGICNAAQRASG